MGRSRVYDARLGRERTWWDNFRLAAGEMASALRQTSGRIFGLAEGWAPFTLDTSRVDYQKARGLYENTLPDYKLGAWAARPVVNTTVAFMGVPKFKHPDPDAEQALAEVFGRWEGKMLRIARNCSRDGDVVARLWVAPNQYTQEPEFQLGLIPPEWVELIRDPLTGEIMEAIIAHQAEWKDPRSGSTTTYQIIETITRTRRTQEVKGNVPPDLATALTMEQVNPWGFVPIVHYRNEGEEYRRHGMSDLEPIEPFMRAYHEVLMNAVKGSRVFTRPKAYFAVKNVDKFVRDNFTDAEVAAKKLDFASRDLWVLGDGEEAKFITADDGLAGATALLKVLFRCIVDVSETPEFAFGTAVPSSKASVSEQLPILKQRVRRRRGLMAEYHQELAGMYLAMRALHENKRLDSYRVEVEWGEVTARNDAETAETLKNLMDALAQGVNEGLISHESAVDFAAEFVPTMLPYVAPEGAQEGERERIARGYAFRERIRDTAGFTSGGDEGNSGGRQDDYGGWRPDDDDGEGE